MEHILMTCFGKHSLKYLGALHGIGDISIEIDGQNLGSVGYEIDGYLDRTMRSANGQIDGPASVLAKAFHAGTASILLADGQSVQVVLSDPQGGPTTEIKVSGRFPL
jgi:hypothetical protein